MEIFILQGTNCSPVRNSKRLEHWIIVLMSYYIFGHAFNILLCPCKCTANVAAITSFISFIRNIHASKTALFWQMLLKGPCDFSK
uniref:Uncharacterized protein n=1 Tax=Rhipicephalus zambeziensis TaxID=60191 RepID=A0A224Y5Z7_9ACAR